MSKRKHPRSRIENPDPEKPVEPCSHIPGSVQKVEALKGRYANHQLLHVEGDLLEDKDVQIKQAKAPRKDGLNFPTGEVEKVEGAGGNRRLADHTVHSDRSRTPVGALGRMNVVGKNIKKIRLGRKMGLRRLARHAGMDWATVRKLEEGKIINPGIYTIILIADALNVSFDELIGRNRRPSTGLDLLSMDQ